MSFMRRLVVGVHRRRRHAPLRLVHRLAQLVQVALALERRTRAPRCRAGRRASPRASSSRATSPDTRSCCGTSQLLLRRLLGRIAHPGQLLDVLGQRLVERRHQLVHVLPCAAGGKFCFTQSCPTASPSSRRSAACSASTAASAPSAPPGSCAKNSKFSSHEIVREPGRRIVDRVPPEVALPHVQVPAPICLFSVSAKPGCDTFSVSNFADADACRSTSPSRTPAPAAPARPPS